MVLGVVALECSGGYQSDQIVFTMLVIALLPAQVAAGPSKFLPIIRGVTWFGQVVKTAQRVVSTVEHREVLLKAT